MLKSRFFRRPIAVAKMTISPEQPWPVKVATGALILGFSGAIALWTYDLGRSFAQGSKSSVEQLEMLQKQRDQLLSERESLTQSANTVESRQNIDRSTQKQLGDQVKALTAENLKLKDDLAFFESLMTTSTGGEGVTVQRIKAEFVAPNQIHYRVLVMQGGKGGRDFAGEMQFNLSMMQAGKPVNMLFPDPKSGDAAKLKLLFRHYQKLEGVITLPDGATVKNVQARVLDKGYQRAQMSINL